mgnify:CR=1 FL=1
MIDYGFTHASYKNCPLGKVPKDIITTKLQPTECGDCKDPKWKPESDYEKMLKDEGCAILANMVKDDIIGFFLGVGFCLICAGFMYMWLECFVKKVDESKKKTHM